MHAALFVRALSPQDNERLQELFAGTPAQETKEREGWILPDATAYEDLPGELEHKLNSIGIRAEITGFVTGVTGGQQCY